MVVRHIEPEGASQAGKALRHGSGSGRGRVASLRSLVGSAGSSSGCGTSGRRGGRRGGSGHGAGGSDGARRGSGVPNGMTIVFLQVCE